MVFRNGDRRVFFSAVFFAFGMGCGIVTANCASASTAAVTVKRLLGFFETSAVGASILVAAGVPVILLLLGMTLFGALLILPCVLLTGGIAGWLLFCLLRCGEAAGPLRLLCLIALIPQVPCMLRVAAVSMHLSDSLRTLAAGSGLRRPDVSADLRALALCFSVLLLSAVLLALFLRRWFPG